MGRHQKSQSLRSRKRHKDVSSAVFENTAFHDTARNLTNEPLKGGFETAMPRAFREMQRAMKQVADHEAGKKVVRRRPREDLPRPEHAERKGGKKKKKGAAAGSGWDSGGAEGSSRFGFGLNDADDESQRISHDAGGQAGGQSKHAGKKRPRDQPEEQQPESEFALPIFHEAAAKRAKAAKAAEFAKSTPAKFGSTNDAPPTLLVGGNLKKMAERRAGVSKESMLAQQRAQAIASYAAAKKARREEASGQPK